MSATGLVIKKCTPCSLLGSYAPFCLSHMLRVCSKVQTLRQSIVCLGKGRQAFPFGEIVVLSRFVWSLLFFLCSSRGSGVFAHLEKGVIHCPSRGSGVFADLEMGVIHCPSRGLGVFVCLEMVLFGHLGLVIYFVCSQAGLALLGLGFSFFIF